jgi:phage terminase large subunit-like protein
MKKLPNSLPLDDMFESVLNSSDPELEKLAMGFETEGVEELKRRKERNQLKYYVPYPKQAEFHDAGAQHTERLFMAGNQLGKTIAGGMEVAMHLTGRYPEGWKGRVFDEPVRWWASGVTKESTRDNPQRILLGNPQEPHNYGTGSIPHDALIEWTAGRGIPYAVDSILVRWKRSGRVGTSVVSFKSYDQGREKWQGETLHGVWFDEEPPEDIYTEGTTRLNVKNGLAMVTFTPLLGMSEVVKKFLGEADVEQLRRLVK